MISRGEKKKKEENKQGTSNQGCNIMSGATITSAIIRFKLQLSLFSVPCSIRHPMYWFNFFGINFGRRKVLKYSPWVGVLTWRFTFPLSRTTNPEIILLQKALLNPDSFLFFAYNCKWEQNEIKRSILKLFSLKLELYVIIKMYWYILQNNKY